MSLNTPSLFTNLSILLITPFLFLDTTVGILALGNPFKLSAIPADTLFTYDSLAGWTSSSAGIYMLWTSNLCWGGGSGTGREAATLEMDVTLQLCV